MVKVTNQSTGDTENVPEGADLKDVTKDAGWPIAYGCEDGLCGTCIIEVTEGMEGLNEKGEVENQTLEMMCMNDGNHRLACQCKVKGDCSFKQL